MRRAFNIAVDAYWRFLADDGWAIASHIALSALMAMFPFFILLTSLAVDRFLIFYGRFKRHFHTVEVLSGVLLIAIGGLIVSGHFTWLSSKLGFLNRFVL